MSGTGTEKGAGLRLDDMPVGEDVELESMELPEGEMASLMERGVMPGSRIRLVRRSPFGDPVIRVDGTVLAVRRELASCLVVRPLDEETG